MKRILLADDSVVVRRTLRRVFNEAGWNVCGEASNGQEAIAKARELRPDIVVLDLSPTFPRPFDVPDKRPYGRPHP